MSFQYRVSDVTIPLWFTVAVAVVHCCTADCWVNSYVALAGRGSGECQDADLGVGNPPIDAKYLDVNGIWPGHRLCDCEGIEFGRYVGCVST